MEIYQQFKSSKETMKYTCVAGPNYLCGVDQDENKIVMIPDLDMWKGFFIEGEQVLDKTPISLYMKIFGDKILGFGRDKVGIFMISGKINEADKK